MSETAGQGLNRAAVEATVAALGAAGMLDDRSRAVVEAALSLASAVDDSSFCSECGRKGDNASLWKEYRAALQTLLEYEPVTADNDDGFNDAVRTPLGNPKEPG